MFVNQDFPFCSRKSFAWIWNSLKEQKEEERMRLGWLEGERDSCQDPCCGLPVPAPGRPAWCWLKPHLKPSATGVAGRGCRDDAIQGTSAECVHLKIEWTAPSVSGHSGWDGKGMERGNILICHQVALTPALKWPSLYILCFTYKRIYK